MGQFESGMNGNFTYIPSQQECNSYQTYDYNTGGYVTKDDCYTTLAHWQVPNASDYSGNLTYSHSQVSQSNVQFQNGQEVSNFYMTQSNAGLPADSGSWASITTVRQKIMDYFHYAIVQGDTVGTSYGDCAATCGQGVFQQQCCGEFSMVNTGQYAV
jgi:hypothetical protein